VGTEVVVVASEQRVVKAMNQAPAVVVVPEAVQANVRSPALKCLSILLTLLRAQGHATRYLPAHLRMVALQTVDHD
jgi:hypothetical protein